MRSIRQVTRRSALGALAAAPTLVRGVESALADFDPGDARERIDIAVVGGGVSGAYCCWRLQAAQNGRHPVFFEMSDRIGGRLLSIDLSNFEMPNIIAEMGGMRFLDSQMMVSSLVTRLGLHVSDFPVNGPNNFAALRGKLIRNADFAYPDRVPYKLLPTEIGLSPGQLLGKAITTVIPSAMSLTPLEWETVKQGQKWNGEFLYNMGLWNVLLSPNQPGSPPVLSSEAYGLLFDGGGYQSLVDNWNCAEAFEFLLADFPSTAHYRRLTKGYQRLPETLAEQFKNGGGKIKMEHQLIRFSPHRSDGGTLIDLDVWDDKERVMRYYRANGLILAMPQRSLAILAETTPILNEPEARNLLRSVMSMPALKALVPFPKPWWQRANVTAGRSTTDLPIRQVYYMETAATNDATNTNSLMLATYADGRTESFWRSLLDPTKEKYAEKPNIFLPPDDPARKYTSEEREVFMRVLKPMLARMHELQLSEIPDPYLPRVKDWSADPYGGGWHFWRPMIKVWDTMPRVRRPIAHTPVYICGEAYANQQGWVEGALTSAEHVLQDHFGLGWPSWLPSDYYIGP
jgi:monoamine oxidase